MSFVLGHRSAAYRSNLCVRPESTTSQFHPGCAALEDGTILTIILTPPACRGAMSPLPVVKPNVFSLCQVIEPDDHLVSALHKMGVSLNRARRACVATKNSSREAALAWCVEHADDPAMDAPLPLQARRLSPGSHTNRPGTRAPAATGLECLGRGKPERFSAGSTGGREKVNGVDAGMMHRAREEDARAAREVASCALEAYVRARLSGIRGDGAVGGASGAGVDGATSDRSEGNATGGGDAAVGTASQEEMRELVSVLSTFRTRASLGAAEDRVRSLLPRADLTRFASDANYRQSELERAASEVLGGKAASDIVALGREYPDTDAWSVAAAAMSALLGPGYSKLRQEGLTGASAAARIHAELRTGSDGNVSGGGETDSSAHGSPGGGLLEVLAEETNLRGGALEIARDVFMRFADGTDLHHVDLLLRVMAEGATTAATAAATARGDGEGVVTTSTKSEAERRLSAHCGLVRRLLKAAPLGLDYKRLLGPDPLADPLADPHPPGGSVAASVAAAGGVAGVGVSKPPKRGAAGLAAARDRVMAELRSVMELEHAPALSKLAKRVPGLTGSAVYLATAQRLLCGETGRLSQEALELLRGTTGATGGIDDVTQEEEEADVASASVYHLVAPLLPKMVVEDLVEVVTAACVPGAAGGAGMASFPCRRHAKSRVAGSSPSLPLSSSAPPFPDKMEPLRLTVRCRRRILADGVAALATGKGTVAGGEAAAAATASTAAADERFNQLGALLRALDAAPIGGQTRLALEGAWVLTLRGLGPSPGVSGSGVDGTGGTVEMGGAYPSAEEATAEAVVGMAEMGETPTAVEVVCSSMQAALGLPPATQAASTNSDGKGASPAVSTEVCGDESSRHHLLNPSTVYATATSALLGRLVRGAQEDRTLALQQLRAMCIAATTPSPVTAGVLGAGDGPLSGDDSSSADNDVTPASSRAWEIICSSLESFSRDDDGHMEALGGSVGGGAAAAAVYRARAEVVTLLKAIDYSAGVGRPSGGPQTTSRTTSSGTTRVDSSAIGVNKMDEGEDDNDSWDEGGHGGRGGGGGDSDGNSRNGGHGGHVGRKSSLSPPPPSLSFLRVAELATENFSIRVAPQDVESWATRSVLMQSLVSRVSAAGGGSDSPGVAARRLYALANMLGAWEPEPQLEGDSCPPSTPSSSTAMAQSSRHSRAPVAVGTLTTAVEKVRRMRMEATARALLLELSSSATKSAGRSDGASSPAGADACAMSLPPPATFRGTDGAIEKDSGEIAEGGTAMVEFMRQWWPKLLEVAVDAREWEFLAWWVLTRCCVPQEFFLFHVMLPSEVCVFVRSYSFNLLFILNRFESFRSTWNSFCVPSKPTMLLFLSSH